MTENHVLEQEPTVETKPTDFSGIQQGASRHLHFMLSTQRRLVTSFWDELGSPEHVTEPSLTVLYQMGRIDDQRFILMEFVGGETLESLVRRADPLSCEAVIPMFSRVLDAFDAVARAEPVSRRVAPQVVVDPSVEFGQFGVARATCGLSEPAYGSMVFHLDGSLAGETLGDSASSSLELRELLHAVWARIMGSESGEKGSLEDPFQEIVIANLVGAEGAAKPAVPSYAAAPGAAARTARPATPLKPFLIALGSAALVFCGIFGTAGILANKGGLFSSFIGGSNTETAQAASSAIPEPPITTRAPRLLRQTSLTYPPAARGQKISGVVRLELEVAEDGSVKQARVLSGHPLLVPGITEAVKKWVYEPAIVEGKPAPMTTEVDIDFRLDAAGPAGP
jgi:TonB family protein